MNLQTEQQKKEAIIRGIVAKKEAGQSLTPDEEVIYKTYRQVEREEKSWFERNGWLVIVGVIIFIIRMIGELGK